MPRNTTLAAMWSIGLAAITPAIAADVTPHQRTSSRLHRPGSAPRQATDTWKKGISIFGQ